VQVVVAPEQLLHGLWQSLDPAAWQHHHGVCQVPAGGQARVVLVLGQIIPAFGLSPPGGPAEAAVAPLLRLHGLLQSLVGAHWRVALAAWLQPLAVL